MPKVGLRMGLIGLYRKSWAYNGLRGLIARLVVGLGNRV